MGSGADYETDGIDDEVQLQQAIEYIESLAKSDFIKASNKRKMRKYERKKPYKYGRKLNITEYSREARKNWTSEQWAKHYERSTNARKKKALSKNIEKAINLLKEQGYIITKKDG